MSDIMLKFMAACSNTTAGGGGGGSSDVTPSNTSWWNNMNEVADGDLYSNTVTIAGIDTTIQLSIQFTNNSDPYTLRVYVNNTQVTSGSAPNTLTFNVSNGDDVRFRVQTNDRSDGNSATVRNVSDSNTTLDTFSINVEVD